MTGSAQTIAETGAESIDDGSASPLVCNLCGSGDFELMYPATLVDQDRDLSRFSQYAFYGDIVRCRSCGLVAQKPEHSLDEIYACLEAETYLDEAIGQLNLDEKYHQFDVLLRFVRRYGPLTDRRVLDVGANTGVFLNRLKPETEHVFGIEPSAEAAATARRSFGLDVQNAVIERADLPDGAFDIITMWDVVEHLCDPRGDLARLFASLAPGGRLFISTHDMDGWFARLTGRHYPMLMYQHFYHFSKRTLAMMLERIGYRVLGTHPYYKSWSAAYVHELLTKLWPESAAARAVGAATGPVVRMPGVGGMRVVVPVRNFFVIAAERPR